VDLSNPDMEDTRGNFISRGTLHFVRTVFLWEGRYFERLRISNFGRQAVAFELSMRFKADYQDIFEVRGISRKQRGKLLPAKVGKDSLVLGYRGLDGKERMTNIGFKPAPKRIEEDSAHFSINLKAHEQLTLEKTCTCLLEGEKLEKIERYLRISRIFHCLAKPPHEGRSGQMLGEISSNGSVNGSINPMTRRNRLRGAHSNLYRGVNPGARPRQPVARS